MKTVVAADIHLSDVGLLLDLCRDEHADRLLCLGDLEHPRTVRELLNGTPLLLYTPGNHEHLHLASGFLSAWRDESYAPEISFVQTALGTDSGSLAGLEVGFCVGARPSVAVHGVPGGLFDPALPESERTLRRLWGVIQEEGWGLCLAPKAVFDLMRCRGWWLIFHGHSHDREVLSSSLHGAGTLVHTDAPPDGATLVPQPDFLYIINPGAYMDGHVLLLNDDADPRMEFRCLTVPFETLAD